MESSFGIQNRGSWSQRPGPPQGRLQGYTLLELLVVLTILGILLGVLSVNSLRSLRVTQLQEGGVQLATDLERARTVAQRDSQDATVTLASPAAGVALESYSVTLSGTTRTYTLPNGLRVAPYGSTNTVTFNAPHGELSAPGVVWVVSSPIIGDQLYVKTVGVTGKVILSATY